MFQIPQHVLTDLKCSVCDGYLSSKPLMIKSENEQVCGKCYMIIPTEEKQKCLRQLALESLASVFLFPCRYNKQGCKYNFPWDSERNHEETCVYRYKATCRNSTGPDFFRNPPYMIPYDINQNRFSEEYQNLPYISLGGIRNGGTVSELQNNINLSIEGGVVPKTKPEVVEEHIYDSLTPLLQNYPVKQHCFNCKAVLDEHVVKCTQGHVSCGNCRGSMCMVCVNILDRETRSLCKYNTNGCTETLRHEEANKHQANCAYRDIQCIFEHCKYKNVIEVLKDHIKDAHPDRVISSSELTRSFFSRDETLVVFAHDRMFKFVYYYYKTFVEFFVTFIGSSEEAVDYMYEISMDSGDEFRRKRSKCAGWNDCMLEKGITFERKDLVSNNNKKVNFEVQIKINQVG